MEYPKVLTIKVNHIFSEEVTITLYSGITFFIGPNGSGKTQTLKALRDYLRQGNRFGKIKYLSSNRMGDMELYRSRVNSFSYSPNDYNVGDQNTKNVRLQLETASGDFFTMDDKKEVYIKVAERLSVLFNRKIYLRWDAGHLRVVFEKEGRNGEYSVTLEASGLVNLVSILAALYDDETNILLIDEPEVSLHPQMQSYLLREMQKAADRGKTIIVSTHSTEIIAMQQAKDFSNFIFFEEDKIPVQIAPDADALKADKLREFLPRMGQIYKNGFFAKKILLVEGVSDSIICHSLENKLDLNIDIAGAQIIPVDGKGQFPVITKLFRLIHKEVAILTDLDGFIDNNDVVNLFATLPEAEQLSNQNGAESLSELIRTIKSAISEISGKHQADMKKVYEKHPYWKNQGDDKVQSIKRAMIGTMFSTNDMDMVQWPEYEKWKGIKTRLESIFSLLEKVGCFILRKGALESYYQSASNDTYTEKPSEAIIESQRIESLNEDTISEDYDDLIRPLKYIASSKMIDESSAIRKELLFELPVAIEILKKNDNSQESDIYAAIKQGRNTDASIFEYTILHDKDRTGITVNIKTEIIDVKGFPFNIYVDENVNEVIERRIVNI